MRQGIRLRLNLSSGRREQDLYLLAGSGNQQDMPAGVVGYHSTISCIGGGKFNMVGDGRFGIH